MKHRLFIAAIGTYDPYLLTHRLEVFDFPHKRFRKNRRKIKKLLKRTHVVIRATEERIDNIKLPFTLVIPAFGNDNYLWYMNKEWVKESEKFLYKPVVMNLKRLVAPKDRIELKREMLDEYLERNDI